MPIGWFIAPTLTDVNPHTGRPRRRCGIRDFTQQIRAEGGAYKYVETAGNHWVVKVRASDALLATINAAAGFIRIPPRFANMSQQLSDLSTAERNALNTRLLALGFTQAEITANLGGSNAAWRARTLAQVFQFARSRWRRPGSNGSGGIVFDSQDWPGGAPGSLEEMDAAVTDG